MAGWIWLIGRIATTSICQVFTVSFQDSRLFKGKIDSGPQSGSGRSIDLTDVAGGGKMSQRLQFYLIIYWRDQDKRFYFGRYWMCQGRFLTETDLGHLSVGFCCALRLELNDGIRVIGLLDCGRPRTNFDPQDSCGFARR
jgi:hypothetical protein